ncbi:MAG: GNAT family N-acetyltransferase [Phycisphaeraceae bacterium]|nr:GNAT family N-acetyltransferase [Phycisphaeraceae bacterium]
MPQSWITPLTLRAQTVRLEPLPAHHAPGLFAAADPELFRHTAQHPPEWSVSGFEREIASVSAIHDSVAFAIVLRSTGAAIGRTKFMEIRPEHRGVEIGRTWIGRAYHGTVVNPEIKLLMLRHAFESLTPTAIRAQFTTAGTNLHSQTAIAKLGAVREGVLRHHRIATVPNSSEPIVRDAVFYSLLAAEWPDVRRSLESRIAASRKSFA